MPTDLTAADSADAKPALTLIAVTPPGCNHATMRAWIWEVARHEGWVDLEWRDRDSDKASLYGRRP